MRGWQGQPHRHSLAKKGIKTSKLGYNLNDMKIKTSTMNFKIVIKPKEIMKDYIALHGLLTDLELPDSLDGGKIPHNEVWVREDIYQDKDRFKQVIWHETEELNLMTSQNITYKKAHAITTQKEIIKFGCSGIKEE